MKNRNNILSFGVLAILFFVACKKNDSPPLSAKESVLVGKIWRLYSLTVPKSDDSSQDSSITKPCSDSAFMAFDRYKVYQLADASAAGCDSAIVPYDKGIWSLSTTTDSLLLDGNKRDLIWKIEVLNDTLLKATFQDSIAPEQNWVKTITLK